MNCLDSPMTGSHLSLCDWPPNLDLVDMFTEFYPANSIW